MFPRDTQTLPSERYVIVDLETQGISILTDDSKQFYFGVTLTDDKQVQVWHSMLELISHLQELHSQGYWFIFHNSKFDYRLLTQRGLRVPVERVLDTQVLAYILDNTRPSYSLDALTGRKLDVIQEFHKAGLLESAIKPEQFWEIDWSENEPALSLLVEYCKQDCRATYWLYKTLVSKLYTSGVSAYFTVAQPMLDVLINLETNGSPLDYSMLQQLIGDKEAKVEELQSAIQTNTGLLPELQWNEDAAVFVPKEKTYVRGVTRDKRCTIPAYVDADGVIVTSWDGHVIGGKLELGAHCKLVPFNANAATGHTWWIIHQSNPKLLKTAKKTKVGKPQINKDYIKKVGAKLPDWFPILELNTELKALTMANSLLSNYVPVTGRIYANYLHTRTLTGRLSTSPNLQNIPKPNEDEAEDSANFRKLFVAPPGYDYLCADLDQIELRMLGYYLAKVEKDYGLLEEFMKPDSDAHQKNADTWGVKRKIAKTVIFLLTYGGQPKLMYERGLTSSLEEAEAIFESVHKGQPALASLIAKVLKAGADRGYIQTIAGRRLSYPDLASSNKWTRMRAERQAFNALLQGGAGDVVHRLATESLSIVRTFGGFFMNIVHDEVSVAIPLVKAEEAKFVLNQVWERRMDLLQINSSLTVPVNGTWNIGTCWADAK
jgi:DNA polymerase I-like protein with 3'-5' exonuclease and polymerase domains